MRLTVLQFAYLISVAVVEGHTHKPWKDRDLWFDHDDVDYWASDDDFTLYETDDIFPISGDNNDDQFPSKGNPPDSVPKDIDKFRHDMDNHATTDDKLQAQTNMMGSRRSKAAEMEMRKVRRKYKNKHRVCRKQKHKPFSMIKSFDQLLRASKESSSSQKLEVQVLPESEETEVLETESLSDSDSDSDSETNTEENALTESDGELEEIRNVPANPETDYSTEIESQSEWESAPGPLSESTHETQAESTTQSKSAVTAKPVLQTGHQPSSETGIKNAELTALESIEEPVSEFTEDPAGVLGQESSDQPFLQETNKAEHVSEMLRSKLNPKILATTKELDEPNARENVAEPPWFPLQESRDNGFKPGSVTKPEPRGKGAVVVTEPETKSDYHRGKPGIAVNRPMVQDAVPGENKKDLCKILIGCLVGTFTVLGVALGMFLCRRYRNKTADDTNSKLSTDVKEPAVYVSISSGTLTKQKLASEKISWEVQTDSEKICCEQDYLESVSEKADDSHVPPSYESAVGPPTYLEVVCCDDGDLSGQNV